MRPSKRRSLNIWPNNPFVIIPVQTQQGDVMTPDRPWPQPATAHPILLPKDTICPNLRPYWQLCRGAHTEQVWLRSRDRQQQHLFSADQGLALKSFVGHYTVAEVQQWCDRQLGRPRASGLVTQLVQQLMDLGILAAGAPEPATGSWQLKPTVQWVQTEDGHWILRNLENLTYMQVPAGLRPIIEDLGQQPAGTVAENHGFDRQDLRALLQRLSLTGMLVGTAPPTPPKGKFKPTDLLFYKLTLCNPDGWLSRTFPAVAWIWTRPFALVLAGGLALFAVMGLAQRQSIVHMGMQLWQALGPGVFLPFGLLSIAVVTLHELGHAYTLKRYGGVVPEVGLLFMCLMPTAYTNTTDQYALPRRRQRALVVGAGLLCQGAIAALAWLGWNLAVPGSGLAAMSYLLLVAALFTVAMNLNPMARFDGYYLLIALTGINNLRSRSFGYYRSLFSRQPCGEPRSIRWILALYAPLSLMYLLLVFGQLLAWVGQWLLVNLPMLTLLLLGLWAIYYYLLPSPTPAKSSP